MFCHSISNRQWQLIFLLLYLLLFLIDALVSTSAIIQKNNQNIVPINDTRTIGTKLSKTSKNKTDLEYELDDNNDEYENQEANYGNILQANKSRSIVNSSYQSATSAEENDDDDDDDFCSRNFIDSAYFNGYDTIVTRGDRLWYYYKDRHHISQAFDQRRFTQGDYIQGAFNISQTPYYCLNNRIKPELLNNTSGNARNILTTNKKANSKNNSPVSPVNANLADCVELQKLRSMAVYFLHNKEKTRSYYNLDVRHLNGTQRRVRSRDLPWNMKQVGLLVGNLWPNGWEMYQQYRPVAYLPARYEMIFILNEHPMSPSSPPILTWNNLDVTNWNASWRSKVLQFDPPVIFTGMFEMNGVIYAVGEEQRQNYRKNGIGQHPKRIGQMFRYYVTENDGRDFKMMNLTVNEFFDCLPTLNPELESLITTTESVIVTTSAAPKTLISNETMEIPDKIGENKSTFTQKPNDYVEEYFDNDENTELNDIDSIEDKKENLSEPMPETNKKLLESVPKKSVELLKDHQYSTSPEPSVFLRNSRAKIASMQSNASGSNILTAINNRPFPKLASFPSVTLRETDSIMLTILIAIVIGASVLCIVLACLVINGNKRQILPHFESSHRIEPPFPKPNVIGLDYHRRKNSTSSSLTPFNFLNRYDSMNSLTAIYSQIHHHHPSIASHSNRISPPMTNSSPSPNLHALNHHQHLAGPLSPPVLPGSQYMHLSKYNRISPILNSHNHNKPVSVNISKYSQDISPKKNGASGSNSVPNILAEVNMTASYQKNFSSETNNAKLEITNHRIKSFERFENLI